MTQPLIHGPLEFWLASLVTLIVLAAIYSFIYPEEW